MHIIEIYPVKENVDNTNTRYYLQGTMGIYTYYLKVIKLIILLEIFKDCYRA